MILRMNYNTDIRQKQALWSVLKQEKRERKEYLVNDWTGACGLLLSILIYTPIQISFPIIL